MDTLTNSSINSLANPSTGSLSNSLAIYQGKHAVVLGLGESGLAMARWLHRQGATVRVADTRAAPERLSALRAAIPDLEFIAGAFDAALLADIDFIAVSPGLSPQGDLADLIPVALEKKIPLWGEIELFAQALAQLKQQRAYQPKVIAITGTNGKTTVTSLVGLLCERAGLRVRVAGNISPAALDVLLELLDAEADAQDVSPASLPVLLPALLPEVWVLELSSFQLHTTYSLDADAATVLNVTQDHLDWHGDMASYACDKARIFGPGTVRVLNRDDACVMNMADAADAAIATTGAITTTTAAAITFGANAPVAADCFGLQHERGVVWLAVAVGVEQVKRKRGAPEAASEPCTIQRLMPADALKIRGQHNAVNALAALALCRAIGLPFAPLLHALREYHGEPHRVELVALINGVEYYDDSKGTNVGATVAALNGLGNSFGGADQRVLLIAGGEGKGQDFLPLAAPCARHARAVLLIGRDAPLLRAALTDGLADILAAALTDGLARASDGVQLLDCQTLSLAVQRASELAKPGDCVLLSPACASFDMFDNYVHRAQVFVAAVRDIALAQGQDI
jgi:UDP-N-acetylmuramoylalanine--D-glutamate ligase